MFFPFIFIGTHKLLLSTDALRKVFSQLLPLFSKPIHSPSCLVTKDYRSYGKVLIF